MPSNLQAISHAIIPFEMDDFTEFTRLVKDALVNLYDPASLETNPLARKFLESGESKISSGENLRKILLGVIEWLKPPGKELSTANPEWRSYIILYHRYVEGISFQELQSRLSLSERQLRRAHSQAIHAVTVNLWNQIFGQFPPEELHDEKIETDSHSFIISNQVLNIRDVIRGVEDAINVRLRSENTDLVHHIDPSLPPILSDRITLRQILIYLLNFALEAKTERKIDIVSEVKENSVLIKIQFAIDDFDSLPNDSNGNASLEMAFYWAKQIQATLEARNIEDGVNPCMQFLLGLPRADNFKIMVVDDQITAIRMYQRYLSKTPVQIIGIQDSDQVVPQVYHLQPNVIILDVMMPKRDGWEILQILQADPRTRHIPVVMCSVWNEPELAYSLGAEGFLKKPVTQKDFIQVITRWISLDKQVLWSQTSF